MWASIYRVLRLQLVRVEDVVVDRAQVADEVASPRHGQRARAGQVDLGGGGDEVVRGLEARVALADDEHPLAEEGVGVRGHGRVLLGQLGARNRRNVGFRYPGGHDQAPARIGVAPADEDAEPAVILEDLDHPRAVPDAQARSFGEVSAVPDELLGVRKVQLAVAREAKVVALGEERVPVPAQVDLGVVVPGVDLVDGDEPPVAGERLEERAGPGSGLEDEVLPSALREKVTELQSGGPRADDQILERSHHADPLSSDLRNVKRYVTDGRSERSFSPAA